MPLYGGGRSDGHIHIWLSTILGETCAVCGATRDDEEE